MGAGIDALGLGFGDWDWETSSVKREWERCPLKVSY